MPRPHILVACENSIAEDLLSEIQERFGSQAEMEFRFYTLADVLAALDTLKETDPSVLLVPDVSAVLFFPLIILLACLLAC